MPLDLNSTHWNELFRGKVPEWPEILTKKYWDAKKGKVITAMKSTGIGAAMKTCEDDFKTAKFEDLLMVGGRNPEEAEEDAKVRFKPFINSSAVKKIHDSCRDLNTLATKQAKEVGKNPLIPSSTIKLIKDIADSAEKMMVMLNTNTLSSSLASALEWRQADLNSKQRDRAPGIVKAAQGVGKKAVSTVGKLHQALASSDTPDAETVRICSDELHTACRDMTQPLGNLLKSQKAGATFQNLNTNGCLALLKQLVPYGDGNEASCKGLPKTEIEKKLLVVARFGQEYERLVSPVTAG